MIGRPFQPGESGNPGGRPKKTQEQSNFERRCREMLAKEGFDFIEQMMRSESKTDRKWAVETALDRGFGKPVIQQVIDTEAPPPDPGVSVERLQEAIAELLK